MLAPEEILSLHSAALASLPGRCDILKVERVKQSNGSWKDTTVTLANNMPCRKVPTGQTPSEQLLMSGGVVAARAVATFIVGGLVDVTRECVVIFPSGSGTRYGVAGVLDRTGGEYTRVVVYDDGKPANA